MNSKGLRPDSTNFEQYVIGKKNCSIIWRVNSSKISKVVAIVVVVVAGALSDPVSMTVKGVLSGVEGGTLVSPEVGSGVVSSLRLLEELQNFKL